MPNSGFTGISYPFRIGSRGGVVMSTTSQFDSTHIDESINQILNTKPNERVMEPDIYSSLETLLFEPNDETLQQVLKSRIVEDLERLEERIEVEEDDITFSLESDAGDINVLYVTIQYKVIKYQTYYSTRVKVGEVINENFD